MGWFSLHALMVCATATPYGFFPLDFDSSKVIQHDFDFSKVIQQDFDSSEEIQKDFESSGDSQLDFDSSGDIFSEERSVEPVGIKSMSMDTERGMYGKFFLISMKYILAV